MRQASSTIALAATVLLKVHSAHAQVPTEVAVEWDQKHRVSVTTPSLQVVSTPLLARGTAQHDAAFQELARINANHVRYVPWLAYPQFGVPEPQAPANGKTSWDFTPVDPMVIDLMTAQQGRSVVMNFSIVPDWVAADTTYARLGEYFARILSWYEKGGFTDELGVVRTSGYHYAFDYWEAFNEMEGVPSIADYCKRYDAVVTAMAAVDPKLKFGGPAFSTFDDAQYRYFMNPANHRAGVTIDLVTSHWYGWAGGNGTYFDQANDAIRAAYAEVSIRDAFRQNAKVYLDELGTMTLNHQASETNPTYWNLSAATFAYLYGEMALGGVDLVGMSQLMANPPSNYPDVSMLDWDTGLPNARARSLELLVRSVGQGDTLLLASTSNAAVYAFAYVRPDGTHKVLVVNEGDTPAAVTFPQRILGGEVVDTTSAGDVPRLLGGNATQVNLTPYAVAIVTLATPSVTLSPRPGTYRLSDAGPLSIALSTPSGSGAIHFTIDGTTPNATSPLYRSPISLTGATTISAIVDGAPDVVSAMYANGTPSFGNGSFETPTLAEKGHQYRPRAGDWHFLTDAGIARNSSPFTDSNPGAPDGSQVLFLQFNGQAHQFLTLDEGVYSITFSGAQRGGVWQKAAQTIRVLIDDVPVGTFTPTSTTYARFETTAVPLALGQHKISFAGSNPLGGDNTAFVDDIALSTKSLVTRSGVDAGHPTDVDAGNPADADAAIAPGVDAGTRAMSMPACRRVSMQAGTSPRRRRPQTVDAVAMCLPILKVLPGSSA